MKAYKIVLAFRDSDTPDDNYIELFLEYIANKPIEVMAIESRDIGEWSDDHPLNQKYPVRAEWQRIFATKGDKA